MNFERILNGNSPLVENGSMEFNATEPGEPTLEDPGVHELPSLKKIQMSEEQELLYKLKIEQYVQEEKPYLDKQFLLTNLSQDLNIPLTHCSFIFNYIIEKKFKDWVNEYRINHFIETYPEKSAQMTIEAIALESGFNNRITFYTAFKKVTGKMPGDYFSA